MVDLIEGDEGTRVLGFLVDLGNRFGLEVDANSLLGIMSPIMKKHGVRFVIYEKQEIQNDRRKEDDTRFVQNGDSSGEMASAGWERSQEPDASRRPSSADQ